MRIVVSSLEELAQNGCGAGGPHWPGGARRTLCALLVLGALSFAQDAPVREGNYWVRTSTGSISGPLPPRMQVVARAHIVVRGGAGDQVVYRITQRVRAANSATARVLMGASDVNRVAADLMRLSLHSAPNVLADVEITVPRQVSAALLESPFGDLEAYDFGGNVQAITQGGSIRIDRVRGDVIGRSAGGEIRLGKIGGTVLCSTGGGSVVLDSSGGETNCASAGGDIFVRDAGGPLVLSTEGNIHVDRAAGSVEAHSSQGLIEVGQAGGAVIADTQGGSIQVRSARGVKAESMRGMVRVRSAAGPMNVAAAAGNILAELLAGSHIEDSSFIAAAGDITILIPSNLAVSVMATNDGGGNARIISEFAEVRERPSQLFRPLVLAQGSINGGGPVLRLNVSNGVIYLRRTK
jgi:hypothetical protein